jgi:branched-chain amino acid transport system ATP-binding protein
MLELNNVSIGYGNQTVVHDVTLNVGDGEIVALIGPNGAGKSTLAKAIGGLLACRNGEMRFRGDRIDRCTAAERVARGITLVPEGRQVFATLSVRENLLLGTYATKPDAVQPLLRSVLGHFPALEPMLDDPAGNLSGGQQQMLAIGRGLIARPALLILDEPSLGLAPLLVREIFSIIGRLRDEGRSILLSEQNARLSLAIANRGYVIENGRVAMEGPGPQLLSDPALANRYLGGGGTGAADATGRRERGRQLRAILEMNLSPMAPGGRP